MTRRLTDPTPHRSGRRRGVSLMVAIVLLTVTAGLLLAAAKTAAIHRRSLGPAGAAVQADLLADAAARLAVRRSDPTAEPPIWEPVLPGGAAAVTFRSPDDAAESRAGVALEVVVERDGDTARTRRTVPNFARQLILKPEQRPADVD